MHSKAVALILTVSILSVVAARGAEPAVEARPAQEPPKTVKEKVTNMEKLKNPEQANETAPETFKAVLKTTKGDVTIEVTRAWSPAGADRFYNLVKIGYFSDISIFRVVSGFMAQFGIHGDPSVSAKWRTAPIKDDPVKESNKRGHITFATAGPNTRTTQLFINFVDNTPLDGMGFSPFGKVVSGMDVVDKLHAGYGEGAPRGRGPNQGRIQTEGNTYLKKDFAQLDYILSAEIAK